MQFIEIDSNSNKIKINAIQCYEAWQDALNKWHPYKGSMMWRKLSGIDYLIHQTAKRQNSLGPRSETTEAIYTNFQTRKAELSERIKTLKTNQAKHARLCKAVYANRVPRMLADISRRLSDFPVLANKTLIVGTSALYAYEAAAAVYVEPDSVATEDSAVLWDTRKKISIAAAEPRGFIGLLKSVDKSFEVMGGNTARAANKEGFIVDLIQPASKKVLFSTYSSMADFPEDLVAVEIKGLAWLVSCPKFTAIGIDEQGFPVGLTVPDPRAFALHKHWLSTRDDRNPDKKKRDLEQSIAVFKLVNDKLAFLDFSDDALRAMPLAIRKSILM
ncbi:GSU2403 family nucleotidyltransferase fold protein [Methylovulum psychrotolerans]|uniref:Nucleotidyltransferase-like domain-containing protein n=1 Tax=Methylovulum psychrotolerans TaxID=1704499 RepID=A0A1Z4C311_9GAMM|nr:GSU2403 family nucleotidyltransferase fold protein [Methylovulum psychrotolerans]ASF47918.1 hypothetical protein CEK71_18620 [Methylovulum psychrotolerans]